jgi:hypothetical protein
MLHLLSPSLASLSLLTPRYNGEGEERTIDQRCVANDLELALKESDKDR